MGDLILHWGEMGKKREDEPIDVGGGGGGNWSKSVESEAFCFFACPFFFYSADGLYSIHPSIHL
jgi:hypothetical protein